jgi:hypothetical protein
MLTMLETIAAIKALDTEKDIIDRACLEIISPEAKDGLDSTAALVHDMILSYRSVKRYDLMIAFAVAAGTMGAMLVKPGHQAAVITGLKNAVEDAFVRATVKKIMRTIEKDPEAGLAEFLAIAKASSGTDTSDDEPAG